MTKDQEKLYSDLLKHAASKGNWLFCYWLELYFAYLKRQELPVEEIEQKPVRPLEDKLRADWGQQDDKG